MKISYFAEFPMSDSLGLKYLTSPTKLYLAASSLEEFQKLAKRMKNRFVTEMVYWPVLKKSEGYWISPFSKRTALLRIFQEPQNQKIPVMLDLELPTSQNPLLYVTQGLNFWRNKRLIANFIDSYQGNIYLAEYFPEGKREEKWLRSFGLDFRNKKVKVIKMLYHSMHNFSDAFLRTELRKGKLIWGKNFIVGFGVVSLGIQGNEPILSSEMLAHDLQIAKEEKMLEIVIFRLGGLDKNIANMLKRYTS